MESRRRVFAQVTLDGLMAYPARELVPLELIDMEQKLRDIYDVLELEVVGLEEAEKGLITVLYMNTEVTIPRQCVVLISRYERV